MTGTVFVHAMLATPASWRGVRARMEGAGPDGPGPCVLLPGHGDAPEPPDGADYLEEAVRRVAEGVEACPGTPHLVGHSFGAVASLAHALEAPGSISRLTLIEPVLFAAAPGADAGEDAFADALVRGDLETAAEAFHAIWGFGEWGALPERVRAYVVPRMRYVAQSAPALHGDSGGLLAPGRLEGLDVPVTLIRGSQSPSVTGAILDALEARLPDARRHLIDGAGHMAPMTHPDEVAALL